MLINLVEQVESLSVRLSSVELLGRVCDRQSLFPMSLFVAIFSNWLGDVLQDS